MSSGQRRSGDRASRRTPIVQRLESRQLLAATPPIDAGGLPRELTAAGEFIYYTQDPKADGHNAVRDVIRLDPATGSRHRVVQVNGKSISGENVQVQRMGDRIVIGQNTGTRYQPRYQFWSLNSGDTRARPLFDDNDAIRTSMPLFATQLGRTTYFSVVSESTVAQVYAIGQSDKHAHVVIDLNKLVSKPTIRAMVAWEGKLVIGTRYASDRARIFLSDGTAAGTQELKVSLPSKSLIYSFAVLGTALGVNSGDPVGSSGSRLTVFDKLGDKTPTPFLPEKDVSRSVLIGSVDGMALVAAARGDKTVMYVTTAFTGRSSIALPAPQTYVDPFGSTVFRDGDSLYLSNKSADDAPDPESGAASLPTSGAGMTGSSTLTLTNGGFGSPTTVETSTVIFRPPGATASEGYGLFRFDLKRRTVTTLRAGTQSPSDAAAALDDRAFAADSFVRDNGHVYFRGGFNVKGSATLDTSLWRTDGTAEGTFRVAPLVGRPVSTAADLAFVDGAASTRIQRAAKPRFGSIRGSIVRDDDHAVSLNSDMPDVIPGEGHLGYYTSAYLDLNRNGKLDVGEPTDQNLKGEFDVSRDFVFENVKPGRYDLRITSPNGKWEATRGWVKRLTVKAGATSTAYFGLTPAAPITIAGTVRTRPAGSYAVTPVSHRTVFLDLDNDQLLDANEPHVETDSKGKFRIEGLPVSYYPAFIITPSISGSSRSFEQVAGFIPGNTYHVVLTYELR